MFTSGDESATPRRKRNLGFIELPDHALDVLSHYTQRADWDVVLVVGHARDSHVMRMAEILQIPAMDAPERLPLLGCDRVIVNDQTASLLALRPERAGWHRGRNRLADRGARRGARADARRAAG